MFDDQTLLDFLAPSVGVVRRVQHHSNEFGQGQVWRVVGSEGAAYLKKAHARATHDLEVAAYRRAASVLSGSIPTLLGADDDLGVLLLSEVEGRPFDEMELSPGQLQDVFRLAGEFRRKMDLVEVERDEVGLEPAVRQRFDAWLERAQPHIEVGLRNAVRRQIDASVFRGAKRRFCHRDFAPRNWMVDVVADEVRLAVVDLGHARPDCWLSDLVKLADRPWVRRPEARTAFFEGYGRELTPPELRQLAQLELLHALATAVWGIEKGDAEYARLGQELLSRVA